MCYNGKIPTSTKTHVHHRTTLTRHLRSIALALLLGSTTVGIVAIARTRLSAQSSSPPAIPCTDSDGGLLYGTKGKTTGIYIAAEPTFHRIYGQEPNPSTQKETTDAFSTYYDYCRDATILDEGYCHTSGYLAATGTTCDYGCADGACKAAPASAPASIALSVQAASNVGLAYRPGMRLFFSMTVTDPTGLKSVVVTTSPMMYSSSTVPMSQCDGKTSCEEKVYIIVPAVAGEHFITVTATSTTGQVSTKTVNFSAEACTTDADCGATGNIQWAGASYCASDSPHIMQYGVAATCNAGKCDTGSKPFTKQQCGTGQVCTYSSNGVNICIAQPPACTPGSKITTACMCGTIAFNSPNDWRINTTTLCCFDANSGFYTSDVCQTLAPVTLPQCPVGSPITSNCVCGGKNVQVMEGLICCRNGDGSLSTVEKSRGCPAAQLSPSAPSIASPSSSAGPTATIQQPGNAQVAAPASPATPFPSSSLLPPVVSPARIIAPGEVALPERKLKAKEVISLVSQKKKLTRAVKSLMKILQKAKRYDDLDTADAILEELQLFRPKVTSDIETLQELRDEVNVLRSRGAPPILQ